MSQLLDEIARTLAESMPRRRAIRVLGGALVGLAVPATRARAAPSTHDCPAQGGFLCKCPSVNGLFYRICCPGKEGKPYTCKCKAPPQGYAQCAKKPCDTKCGAKCCDDETEYCASPPRSLCCMKGESLCITLPTPGSGRSGGPGKCCPSNKPKCCANDKRSSCCEPGDNCCAGRCCPPDKKCVNGDCLCPKNTKPCGRDCCKKGRNPEKCCGSHCCPPKKACCGADDCCDTAKGEHCSKGKCCPKGKVNCDRKGTCCDEVDCCNGTCCEGNEVCANGTCCPPQRGFGSGKNAGCCPPGTVSTKQGRTFLCCPPGNPDCCGELPCLPPTMCVNGTCKRL